MQQSQQTLFTCRIPRKLLRGIRAAARELTAKEVCGAVWTQSDVTRRALEFYLEFLYPGRFTDPENLKGGV